MKPDYSKYKLKKRKTSKWHIPMVGKGHSRFHNEVADAILSEWVKEKKCIEKLETLIRKLPSDVLLDYQKDLFIKALKIREGNPTPLIFPSFKLNPRIEPFKPAFVPNYLDQPRKMIFGDKIYRLNSKIVVVDELAQCEPKTMKDTTPAICDAIVAYNKIKKGL